MDDDTARIHSEIDRLTLHTTDPRPLRLFHERSALQKRVKAWKYGGLAVALLAGVAAFFLWFSDTDNGLLKAGAVALAVFCVIALIGRKDLDAKAKDWLARARQLVGG